MVVELFRLSQLTFGNLWFLRNQSISSKLLSGKLFSVSLQNCFKGCEIFRDILDFIPDIDDCLFLLFFSVIFQRLINFIDIFLKSLLFVSLIFSIVFYFIDFQSYFYYFLSSTCFLFFFFQFLEVEIQTIYQDFSYFLM